MTRASTTERLRSRAGGLGPPRGRRLAAYAIDWLVSVIAGMVLVVIAIGVLLATSDLDRHDPSDAGVYSALLILAAWLPLWLINCALAWSWHGATIGMRCLRIAVVRSSGVVPGRGRALWRAIALAVISLPLLVSPLLLFAAIALGSVGPVWAAAVVIALVILSAIGCFSAFVRADGRAWHDILSGTRVVRAGSLTA